MILCQIAGLHFVLSRWREQRLTEGGEHVREFLAFSAASLDRAISQTDSLMIALPDLLSDLQKDQIEAEIVAPSSRRMLAAQSPLSRTLRSLAIVNTSGDLLIAEPPDSIAAFAVGEGATSEGLQVGPVYRSPKTLEPSIQVWRRLDFPDGRIAFGVAKLSIPALAAEISVSMIRTGVTVNVSANGRTIMTLPYDDDAVGGVTRMSRDVVRKEGGEFAVLTARTELSLAAIVLEAELASETALADWVHDATWIVALSLVIWLLEIAAAVSTIGYIASRARSRTDLEGVTQELAASRRRAQSAADARGMFIANMNHELRTPLNAVIGFSEILTEELFGPIGNPRYREYAADIRASGTHLLSLIEDIIDFSTIDMGHRKLKLQTISLSDAIEDALRLTRPQTLARDLTIRVSGVAPGDRIEADALAFRQVLLNLLSNGIKFSPHGESIEIRREPTSVREWVELTISDSGPGVAEEDLDKLGEQFFRTKAATANAIGGAGLGLSISISLMQLMHGVLSVRSELGVGTTMIVRIPVGQTAGTIDATPEGVNDGATARAD